MKKTLFSTILCPTFATPPKLHVQLESVMPVPSLNTSPTSIISSFPTSTNISSYTPTTSPNIITRRKTSAPTKILDVGYYNFIEAPLTVPQGQTYVKDYYTNQSLSSKTTTLLNLLCLVLAVIGLYIHQTERVNFSITVSSVVKHLKHSAGTTSVFLLFLRKRLGRSLIK